MRISDIPFETEKEKVGFPLTGKMIDLDLIANHVSRLRKAPMKFDFGIQKPVASLAFHCMIDAQIRTQKKVCLAGFHRDAYRRPAAVEIPGISKDIMLCHHPAGAHG